MILLSNIIQQSGTHYAKTFMKVRSRMPAQVFMPNRPQADLIKAVGQLTPEKRIYLVTSGNGTGKTTASINILLNLIYGNINIYRNITDAQTGEKISGFFDYPLYREWPAKWPKSIWYVSNADSLKAICKEFDNWINPADTKVNKEGKSSVPWSRMTFNSNNWDISLKTIDQDPQTFESANVGIVLFDEPPPYALYKAAVSRLRSGGIIIIPATPLFGAGWFIDEIIDKINDDGDKWHDTVSVYDNCIETAGEWDLGEWGIQKKGNLTQANIEFTLKNYDPDELEARRDGIFKHLTGRVYKQYDRNIHMSKVSLQYNPEPKRYNYRMIIDPHDRRPPFVTWVRYDAYGRRDYIREWPSIYDEQYNGLMFHKIKNADPYTLTDFIKIWAEIERSLDIPPDRMFRIMDPRYGERVNRDTGNTTAMDYTQKALMLRTKFPWIPDNWYFFTDFGKNRDDGILLKTGHDKVKESLKPTLTGELMTKIDPTCKNLDYGFRNYSYDDLTVAMQARKETTDKVKEIAKDSMDVVRYDHLIPLDYSNLLITRDPYEGTDYEAIIEDPDAVTPDWRDRFNRNHPDRPIEVERPPGAMGV